MNPPAKTVSESRPRFDVRGVVLTALDLAWTDWPECAAEAGLTTIGLHDASSPDRVLDFIASEQAFDSNFCDVRHIEFWRVTTRTIVASSIAVRGRDGL